VNLAPENGGRKENHAPRDEPRPDEGPSSGRGYRRCRWTATRGRYARHRGLGSCASARSSQVKSCTPLASAAPSVSRGRGFSWSRVATMIFPVRAYANFRLSTIVVKPLFSRDAQSSFERSGLIVDPGMYDLRVARARMHAGALSASRTTTSRPFVPKARAIASPITPAPTIATSNLSSSARRSTYQGRGPRPIAWCFRAVPVPAPGNTLRSRLTGSHEACLSRQPIPEDQPHVHPTRDSRDGRAGARSRTFHFAADAGIARRSRRRSRESAHARRARITASSASHRARSGYSFESARFARALLLAC